MTPVDITHHHLFDPKETVRGHINNSIATLQEVVTTALTFRLFDELVVTVTVTDLTRLRDRLYIIKERVDALAAYPTRIDSHSVVAQELQRIFKEHTL